MSDEIKPVLARQMEVYTAFLEHTDLHVGRLIDAIDDLGVLDNTIVYYIIGDNGASAEGTINGAFNEMANFNGMAPLETPEFMARQDGRVRFAVVVQPLRGRVGVGDERPVPVDEQIASHWGGTRNGTIVHWPNGIDGARRPADAVHSCDRRRTHDPRSRGFARADVRERRAAVAHGGHQHAVHVQRARHA